MPLDQVENDEDLDEGGAEVEFSWPEIADILHRVVRRTRLHVTVMLRDGSTEEVELSARRASRAQEWQHDLARALMRFRRY
ncbi:hypothetical protein NKH77_21875 [Streptomyces sp. M19]